MARPRRRKLMAATIARAGLRGVKKFGAAVFKRAKGKALNKATDAVLGAPKRLYDSASSYMRKRKRGGKSTTKSAKRKLAFDSQSAVEGVSLMKKGRVSFNIGGRAQLKLGLRDKPLYTKVVTAFFNGSRGNINSSTGGTMLQNIDEATLPIVTYDLTFKGFLSSSETYLNSFAWGMHQNDGWVSNGYANEAVNPGAFTPHPSIMYQSDGNASSNFQHCTTWLDSHYDVKLLLYGRAKQATFYKIFFWRSDEEELQPHLYGIDSQWTGARSTWLPIVQPYTTNPASITFQRRLENGEKTKKIKILKSFTYRMKEQLSTEDMTNRLSVNYRVYVNKLKNHRYGEAMPSVTDITNVDQPSLQYTNQFNATKYCLPNQRIYMSIMASNVETIGQDNYEAPSYDIGLKQYLYASKIQ